MGSFTKFLKQWMPALQRRKASRHAEEVINSVNAGYWVINAQGKFLEINDAYCRMVGYGREQILAMQIADFEAIATQADIVAQIRRILANGQEQFQTRHRRSNGSWVDLEVTVTATGPDELIVYLRDITDIKRAASQINQLAFYDPLTGLANRRLLQDRIEQALVTSARYQDFSAVLLVDLDQFKVLNDIHGHTMGDALLVEVANRLLSCVNPGDTVARFGGDEFALVLTGLGRDPSGASESANRVARRILVSTADAQALDGVDYCSTASIGMALFCNERRTAGDLLRQAELAMYHAKMSGRNTFKLFDAQMQAANARRTSVESSLRAALKQGEFFLHYQPQLDKDRHVVGAEALARWTHSLHGSIPPVEFIALAEETGLISELGYWILEAACRELASWSQHYDLCELTMAVNVSAPQIHDAGFVDRVMRILQRTGANPKLLKLEITESVLLTRVEEVIESMNALRDLGVQFALDDFGTGYSSLSYLSRLPVSELKIDRSFVSNIDHNESAILICVSVLGLAHGLRVKVVAEGVETSSQFDFLTKDHQCDMVQGYLFSKPLEASAFADYARQFSKH